MKLSILLAMLLLGAVISGCIEKEAAPPTIQPPITEAPEVPALEEEFPEAGAPVEEAIEITEPSFEVNETVDLGSIL